jgi:hypothetical protein
MKVQKRNEVILSRIRILKLNIPFGAIDKFGHILNTGKILY